MKWIVQVIDIESGEVVRASDAFNLERKAEKVEAGVNINLNHDAFYTQIVEIEE
jgi:hypothetical protein